MFEQVRPEDVGVDSRGIIRFLDDMKAQGMHMHKLMILRHGKVIAKTDFAPWSNDDLHMLFSLTKSFTSTAVGFAVQDGLLRVEDRLVDFFPELLPSAPCENMQKITVKHLLSMNTGHEEEPEYEGDDWESIFLRSYIPKEPGTNFMYNTAGSYMLSAIVQHVTGKNTLDYLKEKLFRPLGMSEDAWSEESPKGVPTGGHGLNVRIDDIAKLGQFYLQKGKWNGEQLLNEQWIQDAHTAWSDNSNWVGGEDWNSGYGYQFWMCTPEHVFRGDGACGQFCVILPDQDMVIAINSGVQDMAEVLRSLWRNVLPAVDREGDADPEALKKRLQETETPADWEEISEAARMAYEASGKDAESIKEAVEAKDPVPEESWIGSYRLAGGNPLMLTGIEVTKEGIAISDEAGRTNAFRLQKDGWLKAQLTPSLPGKDGYMDKVAVRGARVGDQLVVHLCYINTPFEDVLKLSFTEHGIIINGRRNVGFGVPGEYEIIGYKL